MGLRCKSGRKRGWGHERRTGRGGYVEEDGGRSGGAFRIGERVLLGCVDSEEMAAGRINGSSRGDKAERRVGGRWGGLGRG